MSTNQAAQWLAIAAAILTAGMWLGKLQQQVTDIQAEQTYFHGELKGPK